jgi:hypothetical protein
MLPHLIDLESQFESDALRDYDPVELVRYALGTTDYWVDLALGWLEQGVPAQGLEHGLLALEAQTSRPQALRHRAKRLRKTA